MTQSFYSHGKLLLTGEYLVLDNATALAIPTKKGQSMTVINTENSFINWKSFDSSDNIWFETVFELTETGIASIDKEKISSNEQKTLLSILQTANQLNPLFLSTAQGYTVTTHLEFERNWGLGSSSTLINNIAQWAGINAFDLLYQSFGGSGYDIACAQHDIPIFFNRNNNKPVITSAVFNPEFQESLFFVHLNQKQNSKDSIKHYRSLSITEITKFKEKINTITANFETCNTLPHFQELIDSHEQTISSLIKTPTVKEQLFHDYKGSIKSLGGWGGDFILVTGTSDDMNYFKEKGYQTILPYREMVL
ncbi:GHMP kinase [Aquimarina sp. TRL1]|uniref:GYDIA family GHMP kinase n=1 Tax=Aquimarina sp. (strain TRL1) TaxID=2736252 RepID=UPI00158D6E64|nr:GYDIA family GHMP kinase [Aquimarina sp. TRL1]QKX05056.1 GHMP kinase [Aquimarina sp. TRL1]